MEGYVAVSVYEELLSQKTKIEEEIKEILDETKYMEREVNM